MMSDLLVIIPAYNEAANIERVVSHLTESFPQYDYIVINDGSRDKTAEICRNRKKDKRIPEKKTRESVFSPSITTQRDYILASVGCTALTWTKSPCTGFGFLLCWETWVNVPLHR